MTAAAAAALPPGAGNPLWHTLRFGRDPYGHYARMARRFGDPFTLRAVFGTLVVTGDPEGARQIFSADPDTFGAFGAASLEPFLGKGSLILLAGADHRRERKLLMPPFHGARMRTYGRAMQAAAQALIARLPSGPFAMQDLTQALSLDVIIRTVFGVAGEAAVAECRAAVTGYVEAATPVLLALRVLHREFGGLGPWARLQKKRRRLDDLLLAQIRRCRDAPERGEDILSLLCGARYEDGSAISESHIRDELLTLLFAGHETTAIALAWAMYWLHRDPVTLERLRTEVAALGAEPEPEAVAALPYLEAVCNETLRLHPIVPHVPRRVLRPFTLKGHLLPVGIGVAVGTSLIHQREDLYPDAPRFCPERFLLRTPSPFEYMPFGGGVRRCLGAAFALYEMKIALAALVSGPRLRLYDDRTLRPVRRSVVLGPAGGVRMQRIQERI